MARKSTKKSGWGTRGRPFSPAEYKRSHIKTSFKMSYGEYLGSVGKFYKKSRGPSRKYMFK